MIERGWAGSLIFLTFMAGFSFYGRDAIPDGTELPVHWGFGGEADRYVEKSTALWLIPAFGIGFTVLLTVLPLIDPRRNHLFQSGTFYLTTWWGLMALLTMVHGMIILGGAGMDIDPRRATAVALSIFWIALGNVMGKVRSNFFAGIRTPWTLSSDAVWDRTHRWAGRLIVFSGLGLIAFSILGPEKWLITAIAVTTLSIMLFAVLLSFVFWKVENGE